MKSDTTILNFTGIYDHESFYLEDKSSRFVDLSDVAGTNCMCDDAARKEVMSRITEGADIGSDGSASGDLPSDQPSDQPSGLPDGALNRKMLLPYGIHFLDNGNYHYMSALFLDMVKEPFSLVVIDHHPDMQRPMFDILSCGGWVMDVADHNEFVRDIHVVGADENLIEELGEEDCERAEFYEFDEFNISFVQNPIYLSIDKDILRRDELITNWDQGDVTIEQLLELVKELAASGRLIGVDVCGECAPDQEGCDIDRAVSLSDDFNRRLLEILRSE